MRTIITCSFIEGELLYRKISGLYDVFVYPRATAVSATKWHEIRLQWAVLQLVRHHSSLKLRMVFGRTQPLVETKVHLGSSQ